MIDHQLRVADRVDFLLQALMMVLTVGDSANAADDRACLDRLAPIDASFTLASASLRRRTLSNTFLLSGFAPRAVMSEMMNDDLRLWVNDLMRLAQQVRPSGRPSLSNAVLDAPSARAFSRTRPFCTNVGDVLELLEGRHVPHDSRDEASKQNRSPALAKMSTTRKKSAALCWQCSPASQCRFSDCTLLTRRALPLLQLSTTAAPRQRGLGCRGAVRRRRPASRGLCGASPG